MGTKTDTAAAVHPAEVADFDVTLANGEHHIEHGLAAVNAALTAGARYAVEVGIRDGVYAEERSWAEALVQEHRDAAAPVVDLNAAIEQALVQHRALTLGSDS